MCGLAGILFNAEHNIDERIAEYCAECSKVLRHRGPDSEGCWVDHRAGIVLIHRRLAILDLSPQGHQPMVSSSGRFVVAYNGEIYNFRTIKNELEQDGFCFRGRSDTEVMLASFEKWGIEAALKRFAGMFAIACWDRQKRKLYLIRDRLGKKPLYLARCPEGILFASELKAFHPWPSFAATIDRSALTAYLRYNYVPTPHTIYEQARKLMPASMLTLSADDLKQPNLPLEQARGYWSARDTAENGQGYVPGVSEDDAVDLLDAVLRQATAERMISDVPLGAFLSGGIDSSTIVALMQAQASQPVRTFTIGFDVPGYNEAKHAKAVADHLGTVHTELYISAEEARSVISLLPAMYDEPFADSSQIPTFLVSRLAREHVAVVLSGDGGDETFGGYNRHFSANSLKRILRIPRVARNLAACALMACQPARIDALLGALGISTYGQSAVKLSGDRIHKFASILHCDDLPQLYQVFVSHWNNPSAIVCNGSEPNDIFANTGEQATLGDFQHLMMWLDTITYLPDDILVKLDRASMAVSLETRCPFLDHRVIELAWRLPREMKFRDGRGKWILRRVLERYIPSDLFERPKMGFGVPLGDWLRGPLRQWAGDLLNEDRLRREGFFRPEEIRRKWREHLSGHREWGYHLWDILMFQAWLENWHSSFCVGGLRNETRRSEDVPSMVQ